MNKNNLIVSFINEAWDKNDLNLLLGDWCLPETKKKKINSKFKFIKKKHKWNNFQNFEKDFIYTEKLSDRIFLSIWKELNKLHGVNYGHNFWRIYLKSWIILYTQVVYDRWINLEKIKNIHFYFKLYKFKKNYISNNNSDFKFLVKENCWNYDIYSRLIKFLYKDKIKYYDKKLDFKIESRYWNYKYRSKLKIIFFKFLNFFNKIFYKKSKLLLFDTYLSKLDFILLSLKFKSFGFAMNVNTDNDNDKINNNFRSKILQKFRAKNDFERFLSSNILRDMPKIYIESFNNQIKVLNNLSWPEKPKLILTSHGINNDIFNLYAATNKEKKTKLVIMQHGGGYFQFKFSSNELFEKEISDYYIGWGAKNSFKKNYYSFGINKPINKALSTTTLKTKLAIILKQGENYNLRFLSHKRLFLHKKYIENIFEILSLIKKEIKKHIFLRTHAKHNFGEYYQFKSNAISKNLHIDDGNQNIYDVYKKSKLIFHTYAITGYLETLALNLPTVVYHDTKKYPMDLETLKHLKSLKKVKIFFDDYNEAVKHINNIWNNIDEWWNGKNLQNQRKKFNKLYGYYNKNYLNNLQEFLKNKL